MAASASPAAASACGSFPSARSTTACAARFAEGLALMLGVTRLVASGEGRAEPGEEEGGLRLIVPNGPRLKRPRRNLEHKDRL
jgi:hypothetical protein